MSRHRDAEIALGALFEKGAGAGGTGVVHRVVNRHAVAQINVFGVLAANLENRVHVRRRSGSPRRPAPRFRCRRVRCPSKRRPVPAPSRWWRPVAPAGYPPATPGTGDIRAPPPRDRRACACNARPPRPASRDRAAPPWWSWIPHPPPAPADRPEWAVAVGAAITRTRSAWRLQRRELAKAGGGRKCSGRWIERLVPRQQGAAPRLKPRTLRQHHELRARLLPAQRRQHRRVAGHAADQ